MKIVFNPDTAIISFNGINQTVNHPCTVCTEDSANVELCNPLPMPSMGQPCALNAFYLFESDMFKCRQAHNRTEHHPLTIPALFSFYRINSWILEWMPNEQVEVGWERIFDNKTYQVIQAHQTQSDWTPPTVPALWKDIDQRPAGIAPWVQPQGTVGMYQVGDKVTHLGFTWQSTAPNNVWEPGVYGWVKI